MNVIIDKFVNHLHWDQSWSFFLYINILLSEGYFCQVYFSKQTNDSFFSFQSSFISGMSLLSPIFSYRYSYFLFCSVYNSSFPILKKKKRIYYLCHIKKKGKRRMVRMKMTGDVLVEIEPEVWVKKKWKKMNRVERRWGINK